ncbi:hypothetical protein CS0771_59580 [Catellatospora sp. IY07-71]|nr:hypothetical protein CS0771_59580 [Catellatospora sp. IY07-71]
MIVDDRRPSAVAMTWPPGRRPDHPIRHRRAALSVNAARPGGPDSIESSPPPGSPARRLPFTKDALA